MQTIEHVVTLVVGPIEGKVRVDAYVAANAQGLSRSLVGDKNTQILVNGVVAKRSRAVVQGQTIEVKWTEQCFEGIEPQDIPLTIIYEDDDMLVLDKAQGMVVHPAAGNPDGTLVNALVHRYGTDFNAMEGDEDTEEESDDVGDGIAQAIRPGIVHRLDKDTSGVMVVARNRIAHAALSLQFKEHTTDKYYIAIVKGHMEHRRGRIVTGIRRDPQDRKKFTTCDITEGKRAETNYLVLRQYEGYALVRIRILTGRTHQIRVHMKSLGYPVLGDPIYSRKDTAYPQATLMLHALQLQLDQPTTLMRMKFNAPMPLRFKDVLRTLRLPVVRPGDESRFLE